jgi:hypothetical protein
MAVMPKTILKSKYKLAIGTNKIDDPNPLMVPIISAINAKK